MKINIFEELSIRLVEAEAAKRYCRENKDVELINPFNSDSSGSLECVRCGNRRISAYNKLIYCPNCLEFGRVDNSKYFVQKQKNKYRFVYEDRLNELRLSGTQKSASEYIVSKLGEDKSVLIHAVCGAGKTEIVFQAISNVLKANKFVCFAIPRIDILYEIAERLTFYFSKTKIVIINSKEKKEKQELDTNAQIYVMTTNQIINYKDAFDLIIVDEVDAFPYEYNVKFDYGVMSARSEQSTVVYPTSTPSEKFDEKQLPTYKINRRWHGFLLPIPIIKYFNLTKLLKGRVDGKFEDMLRKYQNINLQNKKERQLLIFISNIRQGKQIQKVFFGKGLDIPFVYAECDDRKEYIQRFRTRDIPILLTTTILERGVTFDNIDVIVLDSTNELYNKAALIQIAGRVNRKKDYQDGEVFFYHQGVTQLMIAAIEEIKKSNE